MNERPTKGERREAAKRKQHEMQKHGLDFVRLIQRVVIERGKRA